MPRIATYLMMGVGSLTILVVAAATLADERRERAEALREEAASLAEQGFIDEANALRAEANEQLAAVERVRDDDRRPTARDEDRAELIERLGREIEELLELGRQDEAEEVRTRIQELNQRRDRRPALQRELAELHEHLETLHAEHEELAQTDDLEARRDVEQQIEATKREIAAIMERSGHDWKRQDRGPDSDDELHRIEHLHVAADILAESGQVDLAHVLHERAEEMERELHRRELAEAEHDERHSEIRELHALVRELRDDVKRLQAQVSELQEVIEQKRD